MKKANAMLDSRNSNSLVGEKLTSSKDNSIVETVKNADSTIEGMPLSQVPDNENQVSSDSFWSYIHVHYKTVDKIQDDFKNNVDAPRQCFVHRTVIPVTKIRNKRPKVVNVTKQTVSGLVFFQGNTKEIQQYLFNHYDKIYLVKDPVTNKPAIIPNSQMLPFMKMENYDPSAVRIMEHPISYYAEGHKLMRMLTGILKGHEGYVIRKNGDRKFFMPFGKKSIAISNVHKELYEEV